MVEVDENAKPSALGEFEITSVNQHYLVEHKLHLQIMPLGYYCLDTGTHVASSEPTEFV